MLFAALLGGRLLAEGDRLLRLASAACIAAGLGALALGDAPDVQASSSRQKERLSLDGTSAALPQPAHSRGACPNPGNEKTRPHARQRLQYLDRGERLCAASMGRSFLRDAAGSYQPAVRARVRQVAALRLGKAYATWLTYTSRRDPVSLLQRRKPA